MLFLKVFRGWALPAVFLLAAFSASAQRQMENLGRGVVALHSATSQAYIGWRLLATDPDNVGFNIYRSANGGAWTKLNAAVLTNTTDYLDTTATFTISNAWRVVPVTNGVESTPSAFYGLAANPPVRQYLPIPLVTPGAYPPYDVKFCWVGDFDGDGEYDLLVDRISTTAYKSQFLQAYKRDGTFLWQMDMGPLSTNRDNAYEPAAAAISVGDKDNVTVYDLDGDGKAEVIVRTANGTVFADSSQVVTNNSTSQFLSILDGLTGVEKARALIPNPYFADGPLNCHAGVLYLDGIHPSIIFSGENRVGGGAFQRLIVAWDFRNGKLTQRWLYQTPPGQNDSEGHQLRIADVNHDGKDELIRIGSVLGDSNGVPVTLYSTELQHGDRYHVTDIDPGRPGLEMYAIQQLNPTLLATSLQDLGSGQLYKKWYSGSVVDVGRGVTLDMDPNYRGCEMYSTQPGIFDSKGTQIWPNSIWPPEALWWDADLSRELEDGAGSGGYNPVINKYNPSTHAADRLFTIYNDDGSYSVKQQYGARAPFWGDILGDWREELVLLTSDYSTLRIYTTKIPATNRLYCLMQNPTYRSQCTYKGYYQASYVDYYLGNDMPVPPVPPISAAQYVWRGNASSTWDTATANWFTNNLWISNNTAVTCPANSSVLFDLTGSNSAAITLSGSLTPSDVRVWSPKDYTFAGPGALTGVMALTKGGAGRLIFNGTNTYTGRTLVSEGPLFVNGSLPNSPVTVRGGVWLDGRLGGTGSVGAAVRFEEGAGVSPGAGASSPGTFTVSNSVTFAGRCLSDFDLSDNPSGTTNDQVIVTGNLILQGTNTLNIRKLNASLQAGGVYPLIKYSGALTGGLSNLVVTGLPGIPVALTNPPGQIALVVKSYRAPASITWTGGSGGNAWDLLTTSNWLNGAAKDMFAPGDTVRFDGVGTSNLTVNLTGDLNTAGVVVDSPANYTIAGSGAIIGSASFTKTNTGTLTISALNNTFIGKVTLAGGTLAVSELDAAGYASPLGNGGASPTNFVMSGNSTLRVTGESYTDRGLTLNAGTNSLEVFNAADQVTMAGLITGSGAFQKLGAGTLALTTSNSYTGGTVIKAGAVTLGGDTANRYAFGTGTITLEGGGFTMFNNVDTSSSATSSWNLVVPTNSTGWLNADGRCQLTGTLTGSGTFTFWTPYVRTALQGNWSAFTGQINVIADSDGGDFRIDNAYGYANAGINFAANVYAYRNGGGSTTIGAVSGSSGAVMSGTTWTVGNKNTDAIFAGTISGNSITKVGTGTWTLTGSNYYTGTTTVSGGTLMVNGNHVSATGNVTVNGTGTLAGLGTIGGATTVASGGKLAPGNNAIGTLIFNANLTLNAGSITTIEINKTAGTRDLVDGNATVTYGGTLIVTNLSGTLALNDSFKIFDAAAYAGGFSTITLPALNSGLAWNTTSLVTNGTLYVVSSAAIPAAPTNLVAAAVSFSQINLAWSDTSTDETGFLIERSADGTNFVQIASVGAGVTTYTNTGLNGNTTYYYRVRASNGAGDSPYSNIASATTLVSPTGLIWRGDGSGNVWDLNLTANWRSNGVASVFNDGFDVIFDDSGSNNVPVALTGTLQPASVNVVAAKNYTLSGTGLIAGPGALVKSGAGSLSLGISNAYTGGTFISGGAVVLTSDTANSYGLGTGSVTISNATLTLYDNIVSYTGVPWNLVVPGDATATLNADSRCDLDGTLTGEGTLDLKIPSNRTTVYGNWSAFTGVINALPMTSGGDFRIGPNYSWPGLPNAALNLGTNIYAYWTGNLNSGSPSICDIGELSGVDSSHLSGGPIGGRSLNYRVGWRNTDAMFAGSIGNQVANSPTLITKVGGGIWTLSGANTYSGITTISNGVLQFGDGGASGTLPTNSIVNYATLAFNHADDLADAGVISGTGAVVQNGDGTVTFTQSHTYSGATRVNAGTLALTGSGSISNSSAIIIAQGATLDVSGRADGNMTLGSDKILTGNGSVNGNFIIASGAILAPGNSIGTLTFSNNLVLAAGSTNVMELNTSPVSSDRLNVLGTLTCGGNLVITNSGGVLAAGDSFQLFSAQVLAGSFASISLPALTGNLLWNTNSLYDTGTLSVVSPVSTTPTNLVFNVAGGNVILSWPASHTGWTLQVQTNALGAGLGTNWFNVAGSDATNSVSVPINPASPAVFYRLVLP